MNDNIKLSIAVAALRPNASFSVVDGELVWNDVAPRPSDEEIAAKLKEQVIAQQWENIKAERDSRQAKGVKVGEHWFHTDTDSQLKYFGLLMLGANVPANLMWKSMSGEFVPMTLQKAQMIFQTVAGMQQNIFAIAEQHRIAMEASTDPTGYDYTVGWPQVFGEAPSPVIAPDAVVSMDEQVTIELIPYVEPSASPEQNVVDPNGYTGVQPDPEPAPVDPTPAHDPFMYP